MPSGPGIGRRALLRGLGALGLTAFLGLGAPRTERRGPPRASQSALVVGRAYLTRFPDEADPVRLRHVLPTDHLAERIRRDFGRGDVVQLHGWILSRTEARWCALVAVGQRPFSY